MMTISQRMTMLQRPARKIDLVLDTDAYNEIDDQFAISYALGRGDKINLKALLAAPFFNDRSTGPADGMEKSYQELLRLLQLTGADTPALRGSENYLPDEKTPVDSPAARYLAETAMAYSPENPLYVAAIGAITNVASALLMKPEIAEKIVVVWLGCHALDWPDNFEFNCRQDVAAGRVVMGSGAPLVMLPCFGVVSSLTTTQPEMEYWLRGQSPLCDYLIDAVIQEAESYAKGRVWSRVIWDIAAIGWLLDDNEKFMADKLIPTPIPQYDHHLSFDPSRPLCRWVYTVNRDALLGDLFATLKKMG